VHTHLKTKNQSQQGFGVSFYRSQNETRYTSVASDR